jgi:hypothetical protein
MLADWRGMRRTLGMEPDGGKNWYQLHRDTFVFHPKTRQLLRRIVGATTCQKIILRWCITLVKINYLRYTVWLELDDDDFPNFNVECIKSDS